MKEPKTPLEQLMDSAFNEELERLRSAKTEPGPLTKCPTCGHKLRRELVRGKKLNHLAVVDGGRKD